MIEKITCARCGGKGTIRVPLRDGTIGPHDCTACYGLGTYERNDAQRRPQGDDGYFAVHSNITLEEAIALLPMKEKR